MEDNCSRFTVGYGAHLLAEGLGCEVEMTGLHSENMKGPLTYHQEKIIRIAYDSGYYDIPRRVTLDQLAHLLESDCFIRTAFAKQGNETIYTFTARIQSDRDAIALEVPA